MKKSTRKAGTRKLIDKPSFVIRPNTTIIIEINENYFLVTNPNDGCVYIKPYDP